MGTKPTDRGEAVEHGVEGWVDPRLQPTVTFALPGPPSFPRFNNASYNVGEKRAKKPRVGFVLY